MANLAALRGDWNVVVKAVNTVFGGRDFVLLAEYGDAMRRPQFDWANRLSDDAPYPRGRAFDPEREVRWRETAKGRFLITFLSEQGKPPAEAGFSLSDENWEAHDTNQKLTGKWSESMKDWVEVSVPGASRAYQPFAEIDPATKPSNSLEVVTVDYSRDGLVQMTRYKVVQPHQEGRN
jgi:hypothetical protein